MPTLDMWDEQLAANGALIYENRREAIGKLGELARQAHGVADRRTGRIESSVYFRRLATCPMRMKRFWRSCMRRGRKICACMTTTVGIHRDDMGISINGKEARRLPLRGSSAARFCR